MKKLYFCTATLFLCLLFTACSAVRQGLIFTPTVYDRTSAVVDIENIERSTTEISGDAEFTIPQYFEVVAASTTAPTPSTGTATNSTEKVPEPVVTEPPLPEYYMVKFVDYDGYSMISVQNVAEGQAAKEPPMPQKRGELIFRGWDKEFSKVDQSMIVKAIYQKEVLTVKFYNIDGTLLKTQSVSYGEDAVPPEVTPPNGYIHSGWKLPYTNVTRDLNIYPYFTISPKSNAITILDAYEMLTITENTQNISGKEYYRKEHDGVCSIGEEDYAGNILYGNFSDDLKLSGYGFTTFEGSLGLKSQSSNINQTTYALNLYISIDGKLAQTVSVSEPGTIKNFTVNIKNAKTLSIRLEPYVNGSLYYTDPEFIGGIIDAIIY